MHKTLIIKAFEKSENDLIHEGQNNPSKVDRSNKLSDYISDHTNTQLGEKSLRNYYDNAKKLEHKKGDIVISQFVVIKALCHYLGYESYEGFVNKNKKRKYRLLVWVLIMGGAFVIGFLCFKMYSPCWMEWKGDHYEKVVFDADKLQQGRLKPYKEERLKAFKRIVSPNCSTPFFKMDGSVNTWYGKNVNGSLEVFTSLGRHPETGKTLKPMTEYMVNRYWCKK